MNKAEENVRYVDGSYLNIRYTAECRCRNYSDFDRLRIDVIVDELCGSPYYLDILNHISI